MNPRASQPGVETLMGFRRKASGKPRTKQVSAWIDEDVYARLVREARGDSISTAVEKILTKHLTP